MHERSFIDGKGQDEAIVGRMITAAGPSSANNLGCLLEAHRRLGIKRLMLFAPMRNG
jgi:hypothetical protein